MFVSGDLKRLLDETTVLLEEVKDAPEEEREDLQMRINSNIHALKVLGAEIPDETMRAKATDIVNSFTSSILVEEDSGTHKRKTFAGKTKEELDQDILESAKVLNTMALHFNKSVKADSEIVQEVSKKMEKNSIGNETNLREMTNLNKGIRTSTIFATVLICFIITYFVIRFI